MTTHQPPHLRNVFAAAQQHHQLGNLSQAEKLYRDILRQLPQQVDTLNALGMLLLQSDRGKEAIVMLRAAVKLDRDAVHILINLAEALRTTGSFDEAEKTLRQALRVRANSAEALFCLGSLLHDQGKRAEAVALYRRALAIAPNLVAARNSLGVALQESGDLDGAVTALQQAVAAQPGYAEAHLNLGNTYLKLKQLGPAGEHFHACLKLSPQLPQAHLRMAEVVMESLYPDFGLIERHLAFAVKHMPNDAGAALTMGRFMALQGDMARATEEFARSLRIMPSAAALHEYAHVRKFRESDSLLTDSAERLLRQTPPPGDKELALAHYALGKMHDDLKQYNAAFSHYHAGAGCVRRSLPYDETAEQARIARIAGFFTPEFMARHQRDDNFGEGLVFVVGMPRSGTTLTEQILSSHPAVLGAGELYNLTILEENLQNLLAAPQPYPEALASASPERLQAMARSYLDELHQHFPGSHARLTDKAPHNFLRIGLIALLFPGASIVHCMRDPMDNCLSLFFQNFSTTHAYSYDLAQLGRYYRWYEDLMAHWRAVLPGRIFDIRYEDIITHPEIWSRKLIEHVGLEWDAACLEPHKLERAVNTASHWQVRQPIYKTSVQRWKNYEKHLGPLKEALGYRD